MSALNDTADNSMAIGKLLLLGAFAFMLYKLLNKFFGESEEEKNASKLSESNALNDTLTPDSIITKAVKKKLGKSNPSSSDIGKLIPNKANMPKWITTLWGAKGTFSDDEEKVYGVFRQMTSQFEVNFFAKLFQATKSTDLFAYLKTFMNSEELSDLYKIINGKKVV